VPTLGKLLYDVWPDVRIDAAKALGQIGAPSVPVLVSALKARDAEVRTRAAQTLGQAGPDAKEAVPALIAALQDKQSNVRVAAVDALGEMGVEGKEAAPQLARLFHDRSLRVREHVRKALAEIGPAAVESLCDALAEDQIEVRLDAIKTIALFGPTAKKAVLALRHAMKDRDHRIRAAAAEALGAMELEAADAVPELLEGLRDKKQLVHDKAANALVLMTVAGVPGLLEKVRRAENRDRWLAPPAQGGQGAQRDPIPQLFKDLSDKDPQVRSKAALTLGEMGPKAQPALRALTKALTDDDVRVRFSAAMALARIQRKTTEAGIIKRKMLAEAEKQLQELGVIPGWRNPLVQARLRAFVNLYILSKSFGRSGLQVQAWDTMLKNLGPEAIPALVDGLNYVAATRIGDC
jgi:HEAT repeat protein